MGALVTVNVWALELIFCSRTVTDMGPPWSGVDSSARSDAGTIALSWVLLMNVVGKMDMKGLFHATTAPGTKLEPFTVIVKAGLPSGAMLGLRLVRLAATPIGTRRDSKGSNNGRKTRRKDLRRDAGQQPLRFRLVGHMVRSFDYRGRRAPRALNGEWSGHDPRSLAKAENVAGQRKEPSVLDALAINGGIRSQFGIRKRQGAADIISQLRRCIGRQRRERTGANFPWSARQNRLSTLPLELRVP